MNLHSSRRLSPIPRSDDQESDFGGAEVKDIPFYRSSVSSNKRASVDKPPFDILVAPQTHELSALITTPPLAPLRVSKRLSQYVTV
jgi:hypothetical protein